MVEQVSSLKTGVKYKDAPIGRIPVDWEVVELADICDEIYRYPTYYNLNYVDQKHGVPEIRGELIKENGELSNDLSQYRYISRETSSKFPRTIVREGDFVISVRGTLGKIGYVSDQLEHANITANLMRISPSRKRVYPLWLKQYLLSKFFQNRLNEMSSATTIKTIKAPELKAVEVALPLYSEQKKIAEILTTVDEAIEKTTEIIEKTKEVKKGLMQKLLTRGIGRTKFKKTKIGEIPEEWRVLKGTDLAVKITKGSSPKWQGYEYQDDGMLFITSENVRDGFLDVSNPKFLPIEFHNRLRASQLQKGDILINIVGASIGRACVFKGEYKDVNINQAVCLFRAKEGIEPIFILNYLQLPKTIHRLLETRAGSARQNLSLADINHFPFLLAPLPEQKRITAILSALDQQIEKESNHKARLELLKKGLMQVLLTGKIRVTV